jgi:hypothetical protein
MDQNTGNFHSKYIHWWTEIVTAFVLKKFATFCRIHTGTNSQNGDHDNIGPRCIFLKVKNRYSEAEIKVKGLENYWKLSLGGRQSGVDVMNTIFCDFANFRRKNILVWKYAIWQHCLRLVIVPAALEKKWVRTIFSVEALEAWTLEVSRVARWQIFKPKMPFFIFLKGLA